MLQFSTKWLMWLDSPGHQTHGQAVALHLISGCPLWRLRISFFIHWANQFFWLLRSSFPANMRHETRAWGWARVAPAQEGGHASQTTLSSSTCSVLYRQGWQFFFGLYSNFLLWLEGYGWLYPQKLGLLSCCLSHPMRVCSYRLLIMCQLLLVAYQVHANNQMLTSSGSAWISALPWCWKVPLEQRWTISFYRGPQEKSELCFRAKPQTTWT